MSGYESKTIRRITKNNQLTCSTKTLLQLCRNIVFLTFRHQFLVDIPHPKYLVLCYLQLHPRPPFWISVFSAGKSSMRLTNPTIHREKYGGHVLEMNTRTATWTSNISQRSHRIYWFLSHGFIGRWIDFSLSEVPCLFIFNQTTTVTQTTGVECCRPNISGCIQLQQMFFLVFDRWGYASLG